MSIVSFKIAVDAKECFGEPSGKKVEIFYSILRSFSFL